MRLVQPNCEYEWELRMTNDHNLNTQDVKELANLLCNEYGNSKYFKWYCGAIYEFGVRAIEDLRARVSDAKEPGRLFTKIIKDWRTGKKNRINKDRLHGKENF